MENRALTCSRCSINVTIMISFPLVLPGVYLLVVCTCHLAFSPGSLMFWIDFIWNILWPGPGEGLSYIFMLRRPSSSHHDTQ